MLLLSLGYNGFEESANVPLSAVQATLETLKNNPQSQRIMVWEAGQEVSESWLRSLDGVWGKQ